MKIILTLLIVMLLPLQANAVKKPTSGKTDPRIKHFTYNMRDVYKVRGNYGIGTHIVFAEDENIEHISMGDSLAWHIIPKSNNLFIKPIEDNAETNLTVLTNKRVYYFELHASKSRPVASKYLTFSISFTYPEDELKRSIAAEKRRIARVRKEMSEKNNFLPLRDTSPEDWNLNYSRRGGNELAPLKVFDDGTFTYFKFRDETATPAIFLVNKDGEESLVNTHAQGKLIVVQRVGKQFILRSGKEATCIYNDAYNKNLKKSSLPLLGLNDALIEEGR